MNLKKGLLVVSVLGVIAACTQSSITGLTSNSSTSSTQDIKRIVSAGPGLTFNNMTGGPNDLAINPVTKLPAVAYYDKQANVSGTTAIGALKYAYVDSDGNWNIEVVDSNYGTATCGVANAYCVGAPNAAAGTNGAIIALKFKSDGTPAIAYVYGASLNTTNGYKQIRFAERSSSGWSISVPFSSPTTGGNNVNVTATVDPMKAVTLNFDSSNRPHITFAFYSANLVSTNSALKYLFRASDNSWTTSDIFQGLVSGSGTITALGQGDNQHGSFICSLSSMPTVTTVAVTGAAGIGMLPKVNRCTALSATGACSTWATIDLTTSCGGVCLTGYSSNLGTRTDIIEDPATNKPLLGIYSTTTPANTLGTILMPNTCDQAQPTGAAWSAPKSVGTANQGQFGFRLAASTTNWYIGFLTAATDVRVSYYTGGAWFANGHIVETVATNSANEGVGFAYDSTGDNFYISYANTPAAATGTVGNDMKVGSGTTSELVTGGTAGTLITEVIDNMYSAFPTTAVPMLSSAIASNGTVGYAYFFQDATVADSRLYYGIRSGTTTAPIFAQNIVTSHMEGGASPLFVGSYPSLAYDSSSNPIIAFYNGVAAEQNLNVARSFNGGVSFNVVTVDNKTGSSTNLGQYPSVSTYGTAIGIAYYDVTNTGLKFARWTPTYGWRRFSVDGLTGTGSCGNASDDSGKYAKLAFTSDGRPVIAYQSNGRLKIAYASDAVTSTTYSWTCAAIDTSGSNRGEGIDLKLTSENVPHIVHFDSTSGSIRYVKATSAISSVISTPSSFSAEVVGGTGTTTAIITTPNLVVTTAGVVYVTYYSASVQALILASKASSTASWVTEYIDAATSNGSYISAAGQYGSLNLNSSGYPLIFYRSNENWLKYFSRETR